MNSWSYAFFKSGEDSAVVIRITSLCTLLAIGTFCRNALHTLFQIPFGVLKVRTLGFNHPPCYPEYISKREQWWSWDKEEDSSAWEQMWWPAYQSFTFFDGRFFTWAVFKILVLSSVFKFTLSTAAIQSSPEDGSRELSWTNPFNGRECYHKLKHYLSLYCLKQTERLYEMSLCLQLPLGPLYCHYLFHWLLHQRIENQFQWQPQSHHQSDY